MKLMLIVPDGVGVRNYLYSRFVDELKSKKIEIIVYHQLSTQAISEIKLVKEELTFIKAPVYRESLFSRILRESLAYARLIKFSRKLKNITIMSFWNSKRNSLKKKLLYIVIEFFGILISFSKKILIKFDFFYQKSIKIDKQIVLDLSSVQPDLILNLHQRSPLSAPIIAAAKKMGIQTATVIFSWDNIPKARLISRYDTYFVWSKIMKNQLSYLYPDIKVSQIKIVGTPQFEFYEQSNLYIDKETFFKTYGLETSKKTICYSANDKSFPYDPNYLDDICNELMKINESDRPQILFRQCPVDLTDRFDSVLKKHKAIIKPIAPKWRTSSVNKNNFATIYPQYQDVGLLVNTVLHSDLAINVGSTIAHDFSALDKPTLYLNYNAIEKPLIDTSVIYKYEHFKSMGILNAVEWINSKEDINVKIKTAIETPNNVATDRLRWFESIVNYKNKSSSKLADEIAYLCQL